VKKAHPDGIDAIINNAGVNLNPDGYSEETIKNTLKINYYGTKSVSTSVDTELTSLDVRSLHPSRQERRQSCQCR